MISVGALVGLGGLALLSEPVSASTISLSYLAGGGVGGLNLNSAKVLAASTAIGATSETVQGVTFLTPTSNQVVANGVTIATGVSAGGSLQEYAPAGSSDYFEYVSTSQTEGNNTSNSKDIASSTPKGTASTDSGNLFTMLDSKLDSTSGTSYSIIITISGLTAGTSYSVDLLQTTEGYATRSETISYNVAANNSTTILNADSDYLQNSNNSNNGQAFGYDSNDTVTATSSGTITATITAESNPQAGTSIPVLSGVVVSSVVPEPGVAGLFVAAGAAVLVRRRRHLIVEAR